MLPREPNPAACVLACKLMLWPAHGDVRLLRPCGSGLARVQRAKCGRLMSGGLAWLRAACGCLAAADGAVAALGTPYALENLYPSTLDWTCMLISCVTWTGENTYIRRTFARTALSCRFSRTWARTTTSSHAEGMSRAHASHVRHARASGPSHAGQHAACSEHGRSEDSIGLRHVGCWLLRIEETCSSRVRMP